MKNFIELIDEVQKLYKSENKMSQDLKISRQALKNIRQGFTHPKDETILLICNKLEIDPERYLIINKKETAKGEAKKYWENIEKKLASVAASILATTALSPFLNSIQCILC